MSTFRVTFERIGRRRDLEPVEMTARDADHLAELIFQHAGHHLGSRFFLVSLDLEEGRGWIEGGRFGSFTVELVEVPA